LVVVETQGIGKRGDHARRRPCVAPLLETNEVVDADPGERRYFFSAQSWCSTTAVVGQPHVARLQLLAPGPEELSHSRHAHSMPQAPGLHPGPASTRISPVFLDGHHALIMQP
jgi:hypothetical protein